MSPIKGQKIKDNPKDFMLRTRIDKETLEKLDYLVKKEGSDRSKEIRKVIEIQYENETK